MKLIGIAASKGAGKTSSANYIYGQILKKNDIIDKFGISNEGKLIMPCQFNDGIRMSEVDMFNREPGFIAYCNEVIYPFIKAYNFGDYIKETITTLYKVDPKLLWGSQDERNFETEYTWSLFLKLLPKNKCPKNVKTSDKITGRQFIQYFADVLRAIDDDCFTRVIMNQINYEQSPISMIADVRRISEVEAIKNAGGKIIYLSRKPSEDDHHTENEFKDYDKSNFDAVINNENMTMAQKNTEIHRICSDWNIF